MAATFSCATLFDNAAAWPGGTVNYETDVLPGVGGTATVSRTACASNIMNLAARSPTVMMMVIASDPDNLYVVHSPSRYPAWPGAASPYYDLVVTLLGDDHASTLAAVLPPEAFDRERGVRCLRLTQVQNHLVAAPPVQCEGPHGTGTASADLLDSRTVMVIPPDRAGELMRAAPQGIMSRVNFLTNFVLPGVTASNGTWGPIGRWFRMACTLHGTPAAISVAVSPATSNVPINDAHLHKR